MTSLHELRVVFDTTSGKNVDARSLLETVEIFMPFADEQVHMCVPGMAGYPKNMEGKGLAFYELDEIGHKALQCYIQNAYGSV